MRQANSKKFDFASLARLLPADVAAVVRSKAMDLSSVSLFCSRQAECATLLGSIVQIKPGVFALGSPFRENFIGSLHCYVHPNMGFGPEETVAYALVRHAEWYLRIHDVDALRTRAGSHQMKPRVLCRGPMTWIEGIVRPTGEFTRDPEAEGTAAILVWQDIGGDLPSFAIEICGPGIGPREPAFRRTLLHSMVDSLSVAEGLKRRSAGRPRAIQAEAAAYWRDHRHKGRATIAKELCSCGGSRHTQKCFDRLNKLADSFYRTQRSSLEKLVREQARKYPEIKQENIQKINS
jgi:hypothetical protein